MKKLALCFFISSFIFVSISGCVPLIVGGAAGALGAYAISRDTIQGDTDKPYEQLWNSAVMLTKAMGTIEHQDEASGFIEALDNGGSHIFIKLIRLTRSTVRIKVSARKNHLPNLSLAQDIFVKIIDQAL